MKILVVEDDPMSINLLGVTLRSAGHEMVVATNGREAMDILRRTRIRFVISDWEMPELSGPDLCREIRAAAELGRYVYVILLTGRSDRGSTIQGLSAGADDFVQKPFDRDELAVRIRTGERIVSCETRDVALFALARLAESRDPETGAHLERVRNYARILAEDLSHLPEFAAIVDAAFIQLVYATSPLHDIGKVAIPDYVLLKPGRLDPEEYDIMMGHAELGARTLATAIEEFPEAGFLHMAHEIALTHHEKWNGSGYPHGLKGDDIPLSGRITALADVYDALTSRRVYKGASEHGVARSIIIQGRASHFDPRLVDAFLRREQEFRAIAARYTDRPATAAA
ncbi:MAG: response regulator receiver protein [Phycisphaerales bacterium]|nr:response regulator receiver protein [Phycisphaerales bacterium]